MRNDRLEREGAKGGKRRVRTITRNKKTHLPTTSFRKKGSTNPRGRAELLQPPRRKEEKTRGERRERYKVRRKSRRESVPSAVGKRRPPTSASTPYLGTPAKKWREGDYLLQQKRGKELRRLLARRVKKVRRSGVSIRRTVSLTAGTLMEQLKISKGLRRQKEKKRAPARMGGRRGAAPACIPLQKRMGVLAANTIDLSGNDVEREGKKKRDLGRTKKKKRIKGPKQGSSSPKRLGFGYRKSLPGYHSKGGGQRANR